MHADGLAPRGAGSRSPRGDARDHDERGDDRAGGRQREQALAAAGAGVAARAPARRSRPVRRTRSGDGVRGADTFEQCVHVRSSPGRRRSRRAGVSSARARRARARDSRTANVAALQPAARAASAIESPSHATRQIASRSRSLERARRRVRARGRRRRARRDRRWPGRPRTRRGARPCAGGWPAPCRRRRTATAAGARPAAAACATRRRTSRRRDPRRRRAPPGARNTRRSRRDGRRRCAEVFLVAHTRHLSRHYAGLTACETALTSGVSGCRRGHARRPSLPQHTSPRDRDRPVPARRVRAAVLLPGRHGRLLRVGRPADDHAAGHGRGLHRRCVLLRARRARDAAGIGSTSASCRSRPSRSSWRSRRSSTSTASTPQHVAFWIWVGLYVTTPCSSRSRGGATARPIRARPSRASRRCRRTCAPLLLAVGAVQSLVALVLLLSPSTMIEHWPWLLTPLTAQTLGGWFALPGVTALMMGARRPLERDPDHAREPADRARADPARHRPRVGATSTPATRSRTCSSAGSPCSSLALLGARVVDG